MPRKNKRRVMRTEINMYGDGKDWKNGCRGMCWHKSGGMGCGYFLGFLGAMVYYLQTSTGFWNSVLAILKALVWPAFVIYHLLGL